MVEYNSFSNCPSASYIIGSDRRSVLCQQLHVQEVRQIRVLHSSYKSPKAGMQGHRKNKANFRSQSSVQTNLVSGVRPECSILSIESSGRKSEAAHVQEVRLVVGIICQQKSDKPIFSELCLFLLKSFIGPLCSTHLFFVWRVCFQVTWPVVLLQ